MQTPRSVPGWAEASRDGALPSVPQTAPSLTVVPSARTCLRHLGAGAAAVVAFLVLVILVGAHEGRLGLAAVLTLLSSTAASTGLLWWLLQRWGRAVLAETMRGYTTSPFAMGRFWIGSSPDAPWTLGWVGWDFSGVWTVDAHGHASAPVRPDVLAPGFYPSPRGGGMWELWTGSQWSNWVRPPVTLTRPH